LASVPPISTSGLCTELCARSHLKAALPNNRFERDAAKSAAPLKRSVDMTSAVK
jgi:hypothetical protein